MKNSFSVWSRLQSAVIQAWGGHSCLPSFKQAGRNACLTLGRRWQTKVSLTLGCLVLGSALQAAPPVVSNVTASQRSGTKLVDIYYDLSDADGDAQLIQMQVSADGGLTYTIPCVTLSGHIGAGVTPGSGRHIVWNADADWNGQFVPSTKVRVTANDGTSPPPPPGMVLIPAGAFQMGDNFNEGSTAERPISQVFVSAFFMDKFEVPGEQLSQVKIWGVANGYGFTSYSGSGANGYPIKGINWYSAVKWCNARSEKESLTPVYYTSNDQSVVYRSGDIDLTNACVNWNASGYRLPTEAEWEKAARGGLFGNRYPWGDSVNASNANFDGSGDPFEREVSPVGYYDGNQVPPGPSMHNGYGLFDMAGNVVEWCWDRYSVSYYGSTGSSFDPKGPDTPTTRVRRGGSFLGDTSTLRVAWRVSEAPSLGGYQFSGLSDFGFRCVRKTP